MSDGRTASPVQPSPTSLDVALKLLTRDYVPSNRESLQGYDNRKFGHFFAFGQSELDQLNALLELVLGYVEQRSPPRPLCLAVFGPPGSGKSFAVRQIADLVEKHPGEPKVKVPITTVNLTQVSHPSEIGRILARLAGEQDEKTVPLVFFDEFDTARASARFGWLSWYLAPMNDGEFLHEGAIIRLKRAVYFFAGGTAATMNEFENSTAEEFRFAKGPDFVSRLRGFLDVQGPNADHRPLRRAVILRREIEDQVSRMNERLPRAEQESTIVKVDGEVMKSLLTVGRFRHGARSISAVIELSNFNGTHQSPFTWNHLPAHQLLTLHVDRGPLDSNLIGGSIALSGYTAADSTIPAVHSTVSAALEKSAGLPDCWSAIAKELWDHGATLAYAGGWESGEERPLLLLLVEQQMERTCEPSSWEHRRESPRPWLESFLKDDPKDPVLIRANRLMKPKDRERLGVKVTTDSEWIVTDPSLSSWQQKIIERFRRRLAVTESSVARFAIGGLTKGYDGRMPGIAEELMLTLARGHPVYLSGGFHGAVEDIGCLLGLAPRRTGQIPASMTALPPEQQVWLDQITAMLRPPPWINLPVSPPGVAFFFRKHAIGGKHWPPNGLSLTENRQLFVSTDATEIADLVVRGLRRVFDPQF